MKKCPWCDGDIDVYDHGFCPHCKQYCGCSFDPTSSNDYCEFHKPEWAKEKNDPNQSSTRM